MIELSKDKIIERFRSYVALDTASDDKSETSPSTAKQLKLAKLLKSELSGLGLEDVVLTEYGYVLAALPANTNEKLPVIGLLAHMDTSNEASGANIKMQVHSAYDGSELDLGKGVKLSPKDFPELKNYLGQEIIPRTVRLCWEPTTRLEYALLFQPVSIYLHIRKSSMARYFWRLHLTKK